MKSDTEPAIIAFRNRVAAMCKAEVTTEDAVKGDKQSNWLIENAVMLLRGNIRTILCHIESRTQEPLSDDCHTMVGGARRMHPVQVPESVDRYTSHETFSRHNLTLITLTLWLKAQGVFGAHSLHLRVIHDVTCLSVRCLFSFCLPSLSLSRAATFSLSLSTCSLSCSSTSMTSEPPRIETTALTQNEEYCPVEIYNPLTGYEPELLDNFDCSETSAVIFQDESGDIDTEPSYSCDAELDDEIIGKALSPPLFIQEREEPANLRQAYHSHEESLLPAQSFFAHTSSVRPVYELSSSQKTKITSRHGKRKNQDSPLKTKEQILAEVRTEIQQHEFQADSDKRSIQELNGIIESQRREIDHTIASDEQSRRDQLLLQEQLSEQNRDLRETHIKSLHEMEELKRVQELRIDELSRRRLIENQDTINELTDRIQELQNEVNCMNDSRDFKEAQSVRSGLSHVPSQPALFPPYRDPGGLLSRSVGMPSRKDKPPDIWNTQGISGNVFVNPPASSSSLHPGRFNPWISNETEDT